MLDGCRSGATPNGELQAISNQPQNGKVADLAGVFQSLTFVVWYKDCFGGSGKSRKTQSVGVIKVDGDLVKRR